MGDNCCVSVDEVSKQAFKVVDLGDMDATLRPILRKKFWGKFATFRKPEDDVDVQRRWVAVFLDT